MILFDDLFPIGQLQKPHGINGEISFLFTTDVFDREDIAYFVLQIDGIFVPFFIDEYRFKTNETALLKFDGVDSELQSRELSGLTVYLPKSLLGKVEDAEIELDYFVGFELIDKQAGRIGEVAEIDQTTENALFVVLKEDNEELLIPVGDDYILQIDHENKKICVELPEGLLML